MTLKLDMFRLEDIDIEQIAAGFRCLVLSICFPGTMALRVCFFIILDSLIGSRRSTPTSCAGRGDVLVAEMEARAAGSGLVFGCLLRRASLSIRVGIGAAEIQVRTPSVGRGSRGCQRKQHGLHRSRGLPQSSQADPAPLLTWSVGARTCLAIASVWHSELSWAKAAGLAGNAAAAVVALLLLLVLLLLVVVVVLLVVVLVQTLNPNTTP